MSHGLDNYFSAYLVSSFTWSSPSMKNASISNYLAFSFCQRKLPDKLKPVTSTITSIEKLTRTKQLEHYSHSNW